MIDAATQVELCLRMNWCQSREVTGSDASKVENQYQMTFLEQKAKKLSEEKKDGDKRLQKRQRKRVSICASFKETIHFGPIALVVNTPDDKLVDYTKNLIRNGILDNSAVRRLVDEDCMNQRTTIRGSESVEHCEALERNASDSH